ncbi:hypothetical protein Hypma_000645 [Hypsizygus marmoreus]|uniref:Uncharacterized protein n=1 Tax=Hypsizygus marmoreus TaxID=39966 RepID=A0A369J871_HYPMA|nr:hypothetical protein Hypma_000645 [Hypsizygus marmoreus]
MSSHRGAPLISPLNTPQGSPNLPHLPVIPSPGNTTIIPSWGQAAAHPTSYPAYPTTPYITPGFIPTPIRNLWWSTLLAGGAIYPATPDSSQRLLRRPHWLPQPRSTATLAHG